MEAGGFRRASVAALVAITATVGCAVTPAGAASLDAAGTHVVAFSDTHRTPVASLVPLELTTLQRLYCAGKGDRGGKLSLAAALRVARGLVGADSHGRGLKAFARTRLRHGKRRR